MARRETNVFSLSFLDCMCCGFGAVVLFFMIINTGSVRRTDERVKELTSEAMLREEEILDGRRNLVVLRNVLEEIQEDQVVARGRAVRVLNELETRTEELSEFDQLTLAQREHVARLKADLQSLDEDQRRLEGASHSQDEHGAALRSVTGEGDRQYLTGLKVGGARILILVDASASMLGETVVDVLRLRNMSEARQRASPKWRRAVSTVEWIAAQVPATSEFQILTFNVDAKPLLEDTAGQWIAAGAPEKLEQAIKALQQVVPQDGTSLHKVFAALRELEPLPDTVFLLTDGLPTQRNRSPIISTVSAERREGHFLSAMKQLPGKIPMNVILFPMEGDPAASILYWQMAELSGGSLISPSRDWP
jgi:hypothetical protein